MVPIAPGRRDPPIDKNARFRSTQHQSRQLAERVDGEVGLDEADGFFFALERKPAGVQSCALAAHDVAGQ